MLFTYIYREYNGSLTFEQTSAKRPGTHGCRDRKLSTFIYI